MTLSACRGKRPDCEPIIGMGNIISGLSLGPVDRHTLRLRREPDSECATALHGAFDVEGAIVAFNDAEDHGQPEAGAFVPFCGKERFQATGPYVLAHASPGIRNLEKYRVVFSARAESDCSTRGHCIHGVENKVCQRLAQLGGISADRWKFFEVELHLDLAPVSERQRLPLWLCERSGLLDHFVQIDGSEYVFALAAPIKVTQPAYDLRRVAPGGVHCFDVAERDAAVGQNIRLVQE